MGEGANRCSPEARNDVVREIGNVIDDIVDGTDTADTTDDLTIDNIVILGGDGVVPMAAIPDRTAYSNEYTFARDILTGGASNEVAGTLGEGYLLSDDPYATDAGDPRSTAPTTNCSCPSAPSDDSSRPVTRSSSSSRTSRRFDGSSTRAPPTSPGWDPATADCHGIRLPHRRSYSGRR